LRFLPLGFIGGYSITIFIKASTSICYNNFSAFSYDLCVWQTNEHGRFFCRNSSKLCLILSQIVKTFLCWRNSGVLIQNIKPRRKCTTYYQIKLLLTKLLFAKCYLYFLIGSARELYPITHTYHWNSVYQAMK
jgi:hypothetical protein